MAVKHAFQFDIYIISLNAFHCPKIISFRLIWNSVSLNSDHMKNVHIHVYEIWKCKKIVYRNGMKGENMHT